MNPKPHFTPADLVPLLALARRRYHAATRLGDRTLARCYEIYYNWLFERRRRALLEQLAQAASERHG